MDHAVIRELIAGGVLGGLDRAERITVEAHRPACSDCRRLEEQLSEVATELALCAPPRHVPAGLHEQVLGGWLGARQGPGAWTRPASLGQITIRRPGWAAAALQAGALQVVADPAHARAWLEPSGPGFEDPVLVLYLPGSEQAYLVASGLPPTPDGRVYQFWLADEAGVHAGRTFEVTGAGVLLIPIDLDLSRARAAMLTLEPDGGAQGEPGPEVVFGELPSS